MLHTKDEFDNLMNAIKQLLNRTVFEKIACTVRGKTRTIFHDRT